MTYSIHSIAESSLSVAGCAAWTFGLASSQPYSRAPFYQSVFSPLRLDNLSLRFNLTISHDLVADGLRFRFAEQTNDDFVLNGGTNSAFTFLTAHGAFVQTLSHGYTGHRPQAEAFYFDPSLPPQLSNYTLTGLKWQGSVYSLTLGSQFTTLIRISGQAEAARIVVGPRNDKAGN